MPRTKNRGTNEKISCAYHKVLRWDAGKYVRISKEDISRGNDDSNSVIHQRRLLDEYCEEHADEFLSEKEYSDGGVKIGKVNKAV